MSGGFPTGTTDGILGGAISRITGGISEGMSTEISDSKSKLW